ncbi:phage portal protein [Fontivita pretiosa]|uniref:phage portal protein n=1 Tax=Fontivita pretiosa TaxID=2989684 RepID=UPI003D1843DE
MLGWIRNVLGAARRIVQMVHVPIRVRGRYDAAVTNEDNRRHWANADHLSADAANSPVVRRILRCRARYEVANNSYARGIVLTIANDCIGTGPRLQMLSDDPAANRLIEQLFARWAEAIRLAEKLRTMRMARAESGEVFAMLVANPAVDAPVKLDLRLIEADQIATPLPAGSGQPPANAVDGIVFDAWGNPVEYHLLKAHPGNAGLLSAGTNTYARIPAASMIHYYRADRPGQSRGIPEITPALPLFAQLRRYTLAVIAAAETAADFAAVLFTDSPANGEADPVEPMDVVELERRMATVLPGGWKLGQIQAEQPATTYGEFKSQILNEIARCLNMPFNVAAGNSSGYNYASGRLDHQTYFKSIRVDQSQLATVVLDRILKAWLNEAVLISGLLPLWMRTASFRDLPHQWFWDGQEHVDPAKEANAQATRLANHTTTLAYEYARQGKDWEAELQQRAKEVALMRRLQLSIPGAQPSQSDPAETDSEEEDAPEQRQTP